MGTILISSIIAIIVLVIIFTLFYPTLNMFVSRMFFGKYSAVYFNTVKKYTGKSPFPYCIKDDFLNHIAGFYKNPKGLQTFSTQTEIIFSSVAFGQAFKKFLSKNPKPFCISSMRFSEFDLKVMGYRDTMFSVEMKKYFFFINGIFAFGQLTFKNPTLESVSEISRIVGKKYLQSDALPPANYLISDRNGTKLLCENNGFHLSFGYLSGVDDRIVSLLTSFWQSSTQLNLKKRPSLEVELAERL